MSEDLLDEERWLDRARHGDAEAFGRLVERYTPRLHGYVARYVFEAEDVRDIVQDSFVDAFTGLSGYDPSRPFLPWLHSVCKYRMFKFLRRTRRYRSAGHRLVDDALMAMAEEDSPAQALESERRLAALERCLEELESQQRELLRWRYVHGKTVPAIAARLRRTGDSVGMRLSRLRTVLRRCIEQRLIGAER